VNARAVPGGEPPGPDGWVGRDELIDRCRLDGLPGMRPDHDQALTSVHPLLLRMLGEEGWTPRVGDTVRVPPGRALVVLAMDGVGFDLAARVWTPDLSWPLTSTFPSTSATAWLTSTTGLGVDRHLVPGPYYAVAAGGREEVLFDCFSDRPLASSNGHGPPGEAPGGEPVVGPGPTVFEAATGAGAAAVAVLGDLASVPGRWSAAVLRGAAPLPPQEPVAGLRLRPSDMVAAAVGDVERALGELPADRPTLLWAFVHVDPYAHAFGYDEAFAGAVASAQEAARRWSGRGHVVVAHADHGLTPSRLDPGLHALWEDVNDPSRCRLPSGGAGRVRWSYPRAGAEDEVAGRLAEGLGGEAAVLRREDLERLGLLRLSDGLRGRIGEVVALATGDRFPIPDREGRAEHGSVSPEEMLVPFAVWAPAG
jgi:hypothetical protein